VNILAKVSLRRLIPAAICILAILAATATAVSSYLIARDAMNSGATDKLSTLISARHSELDGYFRSINQDLVLQSSSPALRQSITLFGFAWSNLGDGGTETLQNIYIERNPYPVNQRDRFDQASDGSTYSDIHLQYHPWMRQLRHERSYADIYLINAQGNVLYSVSKADDFAINLTASSYENTGLGRVFTAARKGAPGSVSFVDFTNYASENDAPSAFLAAPVYDVDEANVIGVIAVRLSVDRINAILQRDEGLGKSGDIYLVGVDGLMRNDTQRMKTPTSLIREIRAVPVDRALAGQTGTMTVNNFVGEKVVAAYTPLDIGTTRLALLATVKVDEVFAPTRNIRDASILILIVVAIIATITGWIIGRGITRPLTEAVGMMEALALGKLDTEIPKTKSTNAIGRIMHALGDFKQSLRENDELTRQRDTENMHKLDRAKQTGHAIEIFRDRINQVVDALGKASTSMNRTATAMTDAVSDTTRLAKEVNVIVEHSAQKINSVAGAAAQLSTSVNEISRQVQTSSKIANNAAKSTEHSNQLVQSLSESTSQIGAVVALISDIASQTNLLALNATIEAARAGDAGKGFAVVANEVKNLASQTSKATDEVRDQVLAIQSATNEAVTAMQGISNIISQINTVSGTVFDAVEQQRTAIEDIACNASDTAHDTQAVLVSINGVHVAAGESLTATHNVTQAAQELAMHGESLKREIDHFLSAIEDDVN
jgi:methyl-accepting chemotaxis protein